MKALIFVVITSVSISSFAQSAVNDCVLSGREDIQKVKVVTAYNDSIKKEMSEANGDIDKLNTLLTKYEKFNTTLLNSVVEACTALNK